MKELFEFIYDLITEFDEMGFVPTTTVPEDPKVYAIRWRDAMIEALQDLSKQSDGVWVSKEHISKSKRGRQIHYATYKCSVCGKWNGKHKQNYCPNCGAKMKGGAE